MVISSLATSVSSIDTQGPVSISMLKKALDAFESESAELIEMMQEMPVAGDPNIGSNIDIRL